jgi:hypothetical protein
MRADHGRLARRRSDRQGELTTDCRGTGTSFPPITAPDRPLPLPPQQVTQRPFRFRETEPVLRGNKLRWGNARARQQQFVFVTGCGATAFTGPSREFVASAWRITPTRSGRAIQLTYCSPFPIRPPAPARKAGSIFANAPPSADRTIPMRRLTTRTPVRAISPVASSHSRQISARNPFPGGLSSFSISFPRSP